MILEEIYLKSRNLQPLKIVGMEGIWGIIMMSLIVLPILYFIPGNDDGSCENFIDALYQIKNSHQLISLIIAYVFAVAGYNFCALSIARSLSSIHRTLLDAIRTISIWILELCLYYYINRSYGEKWNKYSYLQVIGFILLINGTLIYNQVYRLHFIFKYPSS